MPRQGWNKTSFHIVTKFELSRKESGRLLKKSAKFRLLDIFVENNPEK